MSNRDSGFDSYYLADDEAKLLLNTVCLNSVRFDLRFDKLGESKHDIILIVEDSKVFPRINDPKEGIDHKFTVRFLKSHAFIECYLKNGTTQEEHSFNLVFCSLRLFVDKEFYNKISDLVSNISNNDLDSDKMNVMVISIEFYQTITNNISPLFELIDKNLLFEFLTQNHLNIEPIYSWAYAVKIIKDTDVPITQTMVNNLFCEKCEYCKSALDYLQSNNKIVDISEEEIMGEYFGEDIYNKINNIKKEANDSIEKSRRNYI